MSGEGLAATRSRSVIATRSGSAPLRVAITLRLRVAANHSGLGDDGDGTERMTPQPASPPETADATRRTWWAAPLILAAATLAGHGWSLGDGLFFDDHLHLNHLSGWAGCSPTCSTPRPSSPKTSSRPGGRRSPSAGSTPGRFRWCWSRSSTNSPAAPAAQHAVSLILHWLTACMVFRLCRLLSRSWSWSLAGGLLFVVYSHSIFAVSWIAAQNCVLQTCLMMARCFAGSRLAAGDSGRARARRAAGRARLLPSHEAPRLPARREPRPPFTPPP